MPTTLPGTTAGAAPAGSGAAPQPVATTAPAATTGIRPGTSGSDVKALQRKLRVRGIKVPVDGRYGAKTRAGVRILQRRLGLKATGIADAALLKKLGLKIRAVASTPAVTPVAVASTAKYLKVFPLVGKYSYSSDFGAARHQGSHEGNDLMASRGIPVVAVTNGVIKRLTREETGLGGLWIWLVDGEGNEFYFAHLDSIVPDLREGTRVTAGQQIATVGNTGDARYGDPHLHFEIHPGGGGAVNPFSDLSAVDPVKNK